MNERAGDTQSDQIKVAIDSATRPVQGGPPEINGTVEGVENGVAELLYTEEGDNCQVQNAIDLGLRVRVRNGKFKFKLPSTTSSAGIGKWIMVKAGDGTNFGYACARVEPDGEDVKLQVK